jgi:hypothetical protein
LPDLEKETTKYFVYGKKDNVFKIKQELKSQQIQRDRENEKF